MEIEGAWGWSQLSDCIYVGWIQLRMDEAYSTYVTSFKAIANGCLLLNNIWLYISTKTVEQEPPKNLIYSVFKV